MLHAFERSDHLFLDGRNPGWVLQQRVDQGGELRLFTVTSRHVSVAEVTLFGANLYSVSPSFRRG